MNKSNEQIAERLIATITKTGVLPWQRPWGPPQSWPCNAVTRRPYSGVNAIVLYMHALAGGTSNASYLTYNQAAKAGGQVRKGETSTPVLFWGRYKKEQADGTTKSIPMAKSFSLFHVSQVDGLPDSITQSQETLTVSQLEGPEQVVAGMQNKPAILFGTKACYNPVTDTVKMPPINDFLGSEEYYGTLFHELTHATGHEKRLNRKLAARSDTENYSKEELVAELGAAFLCGHCGILRSVEANNAAYLAAWLDVIKADPEMILKAASQAQKAYDYIVGTQPNEPHTEEPGVSVEETE